MSKSDGWQPKKVANNGYMTCDNCGKDVSKFENVWRLFDCIGCTRKCVVADQTREMNEFFHGETDE